MNFNKQNFKLKIIIILPENNKKPKIPKIQKFFAT